MTHARERVLSELARLFPGFDPEESREGLVRRIPGGAQKLLAPFVDLNPRYTFSLLCCVRIDAVEDVCNFFNPAPARYHSLTMTSATPLTYFGLKKDFPFSNPRELQEAVAQIAAKASEIREFMDRHQDVCSLHRSMEAGGTGFDNSIEPNRAIRAVVLARLCRGADFEAEVARQNASASDWPEEDRLALAQVVEHLKRIEPDSVNRCV